MKKPAEVRPVARLAAVDGIVGGYVLGFDDPLGPRIIIGLSDHAGEGVMEIDLVEARALWAAVGDVIRVLESTMAGAHE